MVQHTRERHAEYMRDYRKVSPVYKQQTQSAMWKWGVWKNNLRIRYGIDPQWVGVKFLEQQGKCAVCLSDIYYNVWGTRTDKTFSLHVDHDHKTGKPRGLLCQNCNIAIGKLRDDEEIILRAANYVAKGN